MADHKSEKPTPHKLKQARQRGQVAKSLDFNFLLSLVVLLGIFYVFTASIASALARFSKQVFSLADQFLFTQDALLLLFQKSFLELAAIILPVLLIIALFSVFFTILQTGFIFSGHSLKADFTKLNPAQGFKKIVSKKSLFELLKSTLKIAAVGLVFYLIFPSLIDRAMNLYLLPAQALPLGMFNAISMIILWVIAVMLPIVLIDFAFSRWDFMQKMMMTKQEVKDEHKKREGSPEIKSKQKKIQKELLKKATALSSVPQADVVLVNPTQIAIALSYDPEAMTSPKIVAMGQGSMALKIKYTAKKHRVPVLVKKRLVRKMFKEFAIDSHVSPDYYQQLAPIYQWLFDQKKKRRAI
ncbi:EscU/YscU/HrcU family type III secretion system export apparatus switch protein [Catenovulum sp. SM1970]|uniref:EscU/YscU/HrcU family type III secretion system export apparatus switch protein n=1 Tax=Marinifaba aquimaris TaxID=2741323 RepID=UPI001574E9F1|nr:EscU/YscU/HrcU family type III secretion system export apparatus switch protein [Marinifaba aquimaris]NTS77396.1 EscU/YscU/HrcU family type III secretion system export apparatus switch protein [Marinifaba aquimaris]